MKKQRRFPLTKSNVFRAVGNLTEQDLARRRCRYCICMFCRHPSLACALAGTISLALPIIPARADPAAQYRLVSRSHHDDIRGEIKPVEF